MSALPMGGGASRPQVALADSGHNATLLDLFRAGHRWSTQKPRRAQERVAIHRTTTEIQKNFFFFG